MSSRKEAAEDFLRLAGSGQVREAYSRYIAPDFRHHNQYFPGDRASLAAAMEEAHRKSPNKACTVKHCYEDGETVITHSLVERVSPELPAVAVVHIFRFGADGKKIVELWDLGQPLDPKSPNKNGPF